MNRNGLHLVTLAACVVVAWVACPAECQTTDFQPGGQGAKEYRREYRLSLKGVPDGSDGWRFFGPEAASCFSFEPAGLRLSLPPGYPDARPATGLTIPLVARGDFEVTISFDLLREPNPGKAGKSATRFTLDAVVGGPGPLWSSNVATLSRTMLGDGGTRFFTWVRLWDDGSAQHRQRGNGFPTTATSGRLRIVRTGSEVSYWVAEGANTEFTFLQKYPFRTEDLIALQLNGTTGGPDAVLEARLTELVSRADALPQMPEGSPAGRWGWWAAAAGLVFAVSVLLGVWLYRGRNRRGVREGGAPAEPAEKTARREPGPPAPATVSAGVPILAVILIVVGIYAGSIYANRSFAVTDPRDYRFFPPFQPFNNVNMNSHLGAEYFHIAQSLAAGDGFSNPFPGRSGPTAWMAPVMPFIEAGLLKSFDGSRDAVMAGIVFLQVNTLILTGILVVGVVRKTTSRLAGWLAVPIFLAAVCCDFHAWFQFTHDCWLVLLALDLIIIGLVWVRPRPGWAAAAGWGLIGGFGALVSPIVGFVWGILTLVSGIRKRGWSRFAMAALTAGLVVTPWTVRNYIVLGRLIPVKSNAAYELYQSQCLTPDGLIRAATFATHPNNASGTRERQEYQELGEMAFLDHKREQFWQAVWADPQSFLDRVSDRVLGTTVLYVPFNRDEPVRRPWAYLINRITYPLPFLAAVLLVASAARRPLHPVQWAVLGIYVFYLLPYIAVSFYNRYGAPLLVVNVLLIVWAVDRLLSVWYKRLLAVVRPVRVREEPMRVSVMARSVLLALVGLGFTAPLAANVDVPVVETLHADFRETPIIESLFEKIGAKDQMRIEPEGLRITLPGGDTVPETGLRSKFRVKGDFEITLSYELLSAGTPKERNGRAGVSLYLKTDAQIAVTLGRFKGPRGEIYSYIRDTGKGGNGGSMIATGVRAGKLRIIRKEGLVNYQVAAENSDKFEQPGKAHLGLEDVVLRIAADNGKSDDPVDVRINRLDIVTTPPAAPNAALVLAGKPAPSRNRPVLMIVAGLAALMLLLALWRRWRTRKVGVAIGQPEVRS